MASIPKMISFILRLAQREMKRIAEERRKEKIEEKRLRFFL